MLDSDLIQNHKNLLRKSYSQAYISDNTISSVKNFLKQEDAVLIAHYYTDPEIQMLADLTGGFVGDSLEMARWGSKQKNQKLVIGGVKFMGETAKILSPNKQIFMINLHATCSLDLSCPTDSFKNFVDSNKDHTVVVYANTSAEIKALADWVVTSSIAVDVIEHLNDNEAKIIWAPDKYLGNYLKTKTNAEMLIWNGSCVVHEEFKFKGIENIKNIYPNAKVLVHPESPSQVIEIADFVGSTSQIIKAVDLFHSEEFIIATDKGIFYKLSEQYPNKKFIEAPTSGNSATCKSCAHCPWMAMNNINSFIPENILKNEVTLANEVIDKASKSIERMVNFQK